MGVVILTVSAFVGGGACMFFIYYTRQALLNNQERRIIEQRNDLNMRSQQLDEALRSHNEARKAHESEVAKTIASMQSSRQSQATELAKERHALSEARRKLTERESELQAKHESELAKSIALLHSSRQSQAIELAKERQALNEARHRLSERELELQAKHESEVAKSIASLHSSRQSQATEIANAQHALREAKQRLSERAIELQTRIDQFNAQNVSYEELTNENRILKTDLKNISVNIAKQSYQQQELGRKQQLIDAKSNVLGRRYLNETLKWIGESLSPTNYSASKQRLSEAVNWCREIGVGISTVEEATLVANLKQDYERVVRLALEREEQARIRAQIREELQHEREVQLAIEEAEREKKAVETALARLIAESDGKHTEEIQKLEAQLAEALAKSQRAISQAQLTRAGNVYIISNIGSFGQGIYKIGMSRRKKPEDRVAELGGASVPFPFDVHMMIATNDAPKLENALHRAFHKLRVNKTNPRKEFFKVTIQDIVKVVKEQHGEVLYTADPEALQYRQSMNMKAEDQEYIEEVFDKLEDSAQPFADDED